MPKSVIQKFSNLMKRCIDYRNGLDPVWNLEDKQKLERAHALMEQLQKLEKHQLSWLQSYRVNQEKRNLQECIDKFSVNTGNKYTPLVFQKP